MKFTPLDIQRREFEKTFRGLDEGEVRAAGTVRELVFNDQVAELYLGPTMTARLRERLERTENAS